jgi:uncharacterized protein (DUF849 family)
MYRLSELFRVAATKPEYEVYDVGHLYNLSHLAEQGLVDFPLHVQFVLGVKNALPAREHLLDILLGELKRVLPQATWTAAGIGRHQAEVMEWALTRNAEGLRTGLEDNIRITRKRLAKSNAELVELAAETLGRHDARPARPDEARAMLALRAG